MRRVLLPILLALAIFLASSAAFAADAASFRTPEYLKLGGTETMSALDWINAAEAYAAGYTGKGVRVAIIDSAAYPEHREFMGKSYEIYWSGLPVENESHGVYVSGIIAANRDGLEMHGVAYDANLFTSIINLGADYDTMGKIFYSLFDHPEIKIVNNSYGNGLTLDVIVYEDYIIDPGYESIRSYFDNSFNKYYYPISDLATTNDVLFIYAAGNNFVTSPIGFANLPSLVFGVKLIGQNEPIAPYGFPNMPSDNRQLTTDELRALTLNIISVSAFDPSAIDNDGNQSTKSLNFPYCFSNLADGARDYTLFAPGASITTTDSSSPISYATVSGTSMAAPVVTGVAALVQQAFPFMGGKQIADILLSTPNP
ncbi:MAG: S8 family serine peptidase [Desulfovibrio sp.]|jgi:subtilase-type serine protease|nr:S8 family serine peptidase [Desulfovibrio sp.]